MMKSSFAVLIAAVVVSSRAFDPCKIGVGVREAVCKDPTAAVRFAYGIVRGDNNFFNSGEALHEETTDRDTLLPLMIGPSGGEPVGYGKVLEVLGRLACGSWERLCSCRRPASFNTTERFVEVITTKTIPEKMEETPTQILDISILPISPTDVPPHSPEVGGSTLEYAVPEVTCICPNNISDIPAPAPASPSTPTIAICVTVSILVTLGVGGILVWALVKRATAAEAVNRRLHLLLSSGGGRGGETLVNMAPSETDNIRQRAARSPYDDGFKTYEAVSTPRRSPFATVSTGGQFAKFSRVRPSFDPPSTFSPHHSIPHSIPHSYPTPSPSIPQPRGPIPWPNFPQESWLGC